MDPSAEPGDTLPGVLSAWALTLASVSEALWHLGN